ncbi:MAG: hypothetical protein ABJK89_06170 [Paracoccaceae bacterium]
MIDNGRVPHFAEGNRLAKFNEVIGAQIAKGDPAIWQRFHHAHDVQPVRLCYFGKPKV